MAEFAIFDPDAGGDRWQAIARAMQPTDVGACARIFAEREETPLGDAEERVAAWLSNPRRIVLVAERTEGPTIDRVRPGGVPAAAGGRSRGEPTARADRASAPGRVCAYASATYLSPSAGGAPHGWYLTGVVVAPPARRHGLADLLTRARLALLAERTDTAWYFVNARNTASIALHESFGFVEHTREFEIPGVSFEGGVGVLFRLGLG